MFQNPPIIDNAPVQVPDNSLDTDKEEAKQMLEMAAERVADLIWRHWLYIQGQKRKKKGHNAPDT